MTLLQPSSSTDAEPDTGPPAGVDLDRWPAMRRRQPSPARARVAEVLMRRVAVHTGIRVELPDGRWYGVADGPVMRVLDPGQLYVRLGQDGLIGFGEAYMAGDWDADDLTGLLTPMAERMGSLVPAPLQSLRRWFTARMPANENNDRSGAQRNIARHYDLSNDLFATFLDPTLTYSSALFDRLDEPLEQAQRRKVARILDAAGVREGSTVLEIGTGWGELSLQAAARGARVTSVTLSREQAALAGRRVAEAGLGDRVDIRVQDYRDVEGRYDAVVSVEMIEAVGEAWWPTYFRTLDDRLAPGGRIGLQAILMPHDRLLASRRSWTWIHKYIFPGGLLLSERVIDQVCAEHTSLRVVDRLHLGSSYARTLQLWRERFTAAAGTVASLGFDATFRRMWTFYLAYTEAGFRSRYLDVAQLVLARPEATA
jgi:cyclopropane-fatty-acyl-phospholipid synthase